MVHAGGSHTAYRAHARSSRRHLAALAFAIAAAVVVASAIAIGIAPGRALGAGTATFGKSTVGGSTDSFASERKRVNRYSLTVAGALAKLTVYLAPTGTSGQQSLRGVIYEDSAGKPSALLGATATLTFANTQAAGWYELAFPSALNLPAGNYWIGVMSGASASVAGFRYDSVAGARDYNSNAFASGPSNPFGSFTSDSEQMSLYATYTSTAPPLREPSNSAPPAISGTPAVGTPLSASTGAWTESPSRYSYEWKRCNGAGEACAEVAGASGPAYTPVSTDAGSTLRVAVTAYNEAGPSLPATSSPTAPVTQAAKSSTFGKTTIGAHPDSFSAARKRVSRYNLPEAAAVSKLSVYLAPTSVSGTQVLEGVLYADSAGAPAALLGTTMQISYSTGEGAGWYELAFPTPVGLAAGSYWIGVLTGSTAGVAGFRYDTVTGARDYNSNAYASGPSNPFGSFSSDAKQASLYATYSSNAGSGKPTQPQGLTASAIGPGEINLSWSPSSDEAGIAGYTIRRNGAIVAQTGTPASSYSDNGLAAGTAYSYTVEAYDAHGATSPQSAAAGASTLPASGVHHYEYVFPAGAMDIYDMDNAQKLVKSVSLPGATDIRGAVASPATHMLYVSYGGDGGPNGGGSMLEYDLVAERIVWTRSYPEGIDSMSITPDGKTIYMPVGEASPSSTWNVIEASTGNIEATIAGGKGPHNTIVSLNGEHVYMGGREAPYLTEADTYDNRLVKEIGPLLPGGVRPFTINGAETLAYTTATGYLGFQVSSITTGKVLYTVPITGGFPYTAGQPGPSSPSHGISLSPDEKQLWVMDQPNSYVHVFDVSGLPSAAPKQIANIKLTRTMSGSQAGCTYDCLREGWLAHSLDGRFVYVGDSGDVISTETEQSVANLEPLYNSRVYLEIDFSGGAPVATSTRSGVGYVTG